MAALGSENVTACGLIAKHSSFGMQFLPHSLLNMLKGKKKHTANGVTKLLRCAEKLHSVAVLD